MIAADTSSLIAFFAGEEAKDTFLLDRALKDNLLVLLPPVLCELLSDPNLPSRNANILTKIPQPPIEDGFWERAGLLRRKILAKKKKARLADTLICQICLDHRFSLITRDQDFKNFAKHSKLIVL